MAGRSVAYEKLPVREDIELGEGGNAADTSDKNIRVRFLQVGQPVVESTVDPNWSILDVKQRVFSEQFEAGKNIRIIYSGRILNDVESLTMIGVKSNSFMHVAINDRVAPNPASAPEAENNSERDGDEQAGVANDPELAQFQEADFVISNEGTMGDFVMGFALGAIIGMMMLLWVWQPRISRKQKVGILMGVLAHYFLANMNSEDTSGSTAGEQGNSAAPSTSSP